MTASLTWTIKDLDLCGNDKLCSPTIRVGCYEFRLVLNAIASKSKEATSLSVERLKDAGKELVVVSYFLAFWGEPVWCDFENRMFEHVIGKNHSWMHEWFELKEKVFENTDRIHHDLDVFVTFSCDIFNVREKNTTGNDVLFLNSEYLSKDLGVIFSTGEYSDIVLVVQGEKIQAHRIILKLRCPKLCELFEETEQENEYILKDVNASDLRNILRFLYTGIFEVKNLNKDLMVLLDRYCLMDLKDKLLRRYHHTIEAESRLSVLETEFTWVIEDFCQLQPSEEVLFWVPSYATAENAWCQMNMVLSIADKECAAIKFQNLTDSDVGLVRFKLTFEKDSEIAKTVDGEVYPSDLTCAQKFEVQELVQFTVDGRLNIFCNLKLYSKEMNSSIQTTVKRIDTDQQIRSLKEQQMDFYHLVHENRHPELSDLTLKCGDAEFLAHKVFLCARSPVFARMFANDFLEKKENLVLIKGIAPGTLSSMLHYIYCDFVNGMDIGETMYLYSAAHQYELLDLKEKCSQMLRVSLDAAHVGEVLLMSELHHDLKLNTFVYDYIAQNSKAVLNSQGLDVLEGRFDGFPEFLKELLKRMPGDSDSE